MIQINILKHFKNPTCSRKTILHLSRNLSAFCFTLLHWALYERICNFILSSTSLFVTVVSNWFRTYSLFYWFTSVCESFIFLMLSCLINVMLEVYSYVQTIYMTLKFIFCRISIHFKILQKLPFSYIFLTIRITNMWMFKYISFNFYVCIHMGNLNIYTYRPLY